MNNCLLVINYYLPISLLCKDESGIMSSIIYRSTILFLLIHSYNLFFAWHIFLNFTFVHPIIFDCFI